MTLRNFLVATTVALALTPACSKKKDPVEETVSMLEDIGTAVDNSKGDCGKMVGGIQSVIDKYKPDLQAMKDAGKKVKADKAQAKAIQDKYGPRMQKALPKLMGMMACADDPKFQAIGKQLADLGFAGKKE